jgi:hypothetical protein
MARGLAPCASEMKIPSYDGKEESTSFLKKRSKRLLSVWFTARAALALNEQEFFGSFF